MSGCLPLKIRLEDRLILGGLQFAGFCLRQWPRRQAIRAAGALGALVGPQTRRAKLG
ncbi:MAG: hypothetical protein HQL11_05280, partial [Candidatus Omnitrophica bacterium]|nr:hypothetical protein [Candidatus Omnitrophota bacterium]